MTEPFPRMEAEKRKRTQNQKHGFARLISLTVVGVAMAQNHGLRQGACVSGAHRSSLRLILLLDQFFRVLEFSWERAFKFGLTTQAIMDCLFVLVQRYLIIWSSPFIVVPRCFRMTVAFDSRDSVCTTVAVVEFKGRVGTIINNKLIWQRVTKK